MSIGWVMFWKGVVIALWLVVVERWVAFRRRRREQGLPMRYSKRTGSYVVSDWADWVEQGFRLMRKAVLGLVFAVWTVIAAVFVFSGTEGVQSMAMRYIEWASSL